jgi:deoxyribose-phosphate aldolase
MSFNQYIDHTILKAETKKEDVLRIIKEAKENHFCSVCINPTWVSLAAKELADSDVKVCTVIGFPLGANTTAVKAFETADAINNGADEVDMVINIGALRDGNEELVLNDIQAVVDAAKDKALVKVIIETALLTNEEIIKACQLAQKAGADFVKTSTGFSTSGAKAKDVALMRQTVGPDMGVKASGGIHTAQEAQSIDAGATRLGVSASMAIIAGEKGTGY